MDQTAIEQVYDEKYRTPNFFGDRLWLYRPFVKALVRKAGLRRGARLLDAGCGQGFFTSLFSENGLDALGVDVSGVGIVGARRTYSSSGARFEQADIRQLSDWPKFDCVFTRSCSLYNSHTFEKDHEITDLLLDCLRVNGILIFDYYTKLNPSKRSEQWIYHSMENARNHFSHYPGAEVIFSLRLETLLLGRSSLTQRTSRICAFLSRLTGLGGELLGIVPKTKIRSA